MACYCYNMHNVVTILCLFLSLPLVESAAIASLGRSHHHGTSGLAHRASVILAPVGQATAGAAVGFVGYRLAIRSIKKTVEVAAAAILV